MQNQIFNNIRYRTSLLKIRFSLSKRFDHILNNVLSANIRTVMKDSRLSILAFKMYFRAEGLFAAKIWKHLLRQLLVME